MTTAGLTELATLKIRQCRDVTLCGQSVLVTRTGYTGELGYELYLPEKARLRCGIDCLKREAHWVSNQPDWARDLLRLEMAYLLYGNDMNEETHPYRSRCGMGGEV